MSRNLPSLIYQLESEDKLIFYIRPEMTKRPLPEHDDEVDVKREQASSKKSRENSSVDAEAIIKDEYDEEVDEDVSTNAEAVNFVVKKEERKKCPYLDTVNRQLLDFDMEKVCSVTLSNLNVYCCLICGKYFQGRGKSTPAYTHSVGSGMSPTILAWR